MIYRLCSIFFIIENLGVDDKDLFEGDMIRMSSIEPSTEWMLIAPAKEARSEADYGRQEKFHM